MSNIIFMKKPTRVPVGVEFKLIDGGQETTHGKDLLKMVDLVVGDPNGVDLPGVEEIFEGMPRFRSALLPVVWGLKTWRRLGWGSCKSGPVNQCKINIRCLQLLKSQVDACNLTNQILET